MNLELEDIKMTKSRSQLPGDWFDELENEFAQDYMKNLRAYLSSELKRGKSIYPHGKEIFNAFKLTPLKKVKVVIIGQDPYHGPGQAHGVCFSVRPGIKVPPSLANIYKEICSDVGGETPPTGDLTHLALQGVFLLNSVLTVEAALPASHQNKGWEIFTDRVVEILNEKCSGLVFLLWGSQAQKKGRAINFKKHLILKAPHPSPLSSYRGFFGCRHFSQANDYLRSKNLTPISWQ